MQVIYATFIQRLKACVIDIFIMIGVGAIIYQPIKSSSMELLEESDKNILGPSLVLAVILYHIYQPIMECVGGTFGKKMINLKTISIGTRKAPNFFQSFFRSNVFFSPFLLAILVYVFSDKQDRFSDLFFTVSIILGLLALSSRFYMFMSERKQSLQDLISSTIVIDLNSKNSSPD